MNVIGLDLSLSNTGLAVYSPTSETVVASMDIPSDPTMPLAARIHHIVGVIDAAIEEHDPIAVYSEGIVVISHGEGSIKTAIALSKLHGAVELTVYERLMLVVDPLAPTTVKKFATGSGGADKEAMRTAARRRFDMDVSHDVADALFVALCGVSRR